MLEFKIPEVGENIDSGTVISIAVSEGDSVQKDQDLMELETDKATIPIPSPCDGTIKEILIKDGDEINIGQVVMKIEESSGSSVKEEKKASPEKEEKASSQKSPKKAEEKPVTLSTPRPALVQAFKSNEQIAAQTNVPAAPSVRRLARELGLEVSRISGTGPGGRISKDDVKAFAKQIIITGTPPAGAPVTQPLPDFSKWGDVKREAMNNVRKKTASHLSYCWQSIPHVTQFDKADITELDKLRKKHSTDKLKLTITPFIIKVMADALKEFPQFNASIDLQNKEILYKNYFNLGAAVDTDRGLLVPVLKDVDKKDVFQIANELNVMAQKARDRKISIEDLQGGCMTLTNLGGIGGTFFTPIVNWPEVAILGVSRGGWEPVLEGEKFIPRLKLPLSLSYDHRLIDGANGARFIRWVCEALEKPFPLK